MVFEAEKGIAQDGIFSTVMELVSKEMERSVEEPGFMLVVLVSLVVLTRYLRLLLV
jgi:hypothetical protein